MPSQFHSSSDEPFSTLCPEGDSGTRAKSPEHHPEEDTFEDVAGFKVQWNDPEDGWDEEKREDLLLIHSKNLLQPRYVPKLTKTGYRKIKIPDELYEFLLEQRNIFDLSWENCGHGAHQNCDRRLDGDKFESKENVQLVGSRRPNLVKKVVQQTLEPLLEKWSGIKLTPTLVYGFRRYLRGAWLSLHVDRLHTHVVSAILQVDQDVDQPWPLYLVDHEDVTQKIYLEPGEMLFYESAKLPHGRPEPFNGHYFDNIFVHFKPQKAIWYQEDLFEGHQERPPPPKWTKKDLI
ncbi:uncharacterized protein LOC131885796 isoform X2 [Tigriopus californicus]|uniref:uncharacterized protein LOC131885796 isoform X2 n=1 Tax=Tigriopus californicus TaxID=6832 RepID=UPI0027DA50D3|nr:uncharacterized protein LOC131885796 isoform X2 [Tigriopus californicus]